MVGRGRPLVRLREGSFSAMTSAFELRVMCQCFSVKCLLLRSPLASPRGMTAMRGKQHREWKRLHGDHITVNLISVIDGRGEIVKGTLVYLPREPCLCIFQWYFCDMSTIKSLCTSHFSSSHRMKHLYDQKSVERWLRVKSRLICHWHHLQSYRGLVSWHRWFAAVLPGNFSSVSMATCREIRLVSALLLSLFIMPSCHKYRTSGSTYGNTPSLWGNKSFN